jgi:hypothetical protein
MKKFVLMLMIFASTPTMAWYCNEVASERNGDTINACGIGEAADEDLARKIALHNAYKELDLICSHSADCANRGLEIAPLRTDCKKIENLYRCHRGITATVTDIERDLDQKALLEEVFVPKKIVQVDGREQFIKTSIVDFETNPSGALIHVDGVEICTTPCSAEVNQGEHKVLFERSGFDLLSKIFIINSGRQTIAAELINTYGYLTLKNVPLDSVVKIDNKETSGRDKIRLRPNQHIVSVESKFHQPWHKEFTVKKGESLEFTHDAQALLAYLKISATDSAGLPLEANIFLNGERLSERTPAVIQVPAGKAHIVLTHKDQKDLAFDLNLDVDEKEEVKKKMIPSDEKDWSLAFGLGMTSFSLSQVKEDKNGEYSCCILFDLSLQRSLTKNLAIRAIYNYVSGSTSSNATSNIYDGAPNSTEDLLTDYSGNLIGVAMPIYLRKRDHFAFYVGPEVGTLNSKMSFKTVTYDSFGNGYGTPNAKKESVTQSYVGAVTGMEWVSETDKPQAYGWYLLGGARKFNKSSSDQYQSKQTVYFQGGVIIAF